MSHSNNVRQHYVAIVGQVRGQVMQDALQLLHGVDLLATSGAQWPNMSLSFGSGLAEGG